MCQGLYARSMGLVPTIPIRKKFLSDQRRPLLSHFGEALIVETKCLATKFMPERDFNSLAVVLSDVVLSFSGSYHHLNDMWCGQRRNFEVRFVKIFEEVKVAIRHMQEKTPSPRMIVYAGSVYIAIGLFRECVEI